MVCACVTVFSHAASKLAERHNQGRIDGALDFEIFNKGRNRRCEFCQKAVMSSGLVGVSVISSLADIINARGQPTRDHARNETWRLGQPTLWVRDSIFLCARNLLDPLRREKSGKSRTLDKSIVSPAGRELPSDPIVAPETASCSSGAFKTTKNSSLSASRSVFHLNCSVWLKEMLLGFLPTRAKGVSLPMLMAAVGSQPLQALSKQRPIHLLERVRSESAAVCQISVERKCERFGFGYPTPWISAR